jgi:hypothetical protein
VRAVVQPLIEKKPFDTSFFENLLGSLSYSVSGILSVSGIPKGVYDLLANEILSRYEWFECIERAPDQKGIPFDYFCIRDRTPYIITFRNHINQIHDPPEVLKGRITRLCQCIEGLEAMLVQVSLKKRYYRTFPTKCLEPRSESFTKEWPQECSVPVVTWINERIKETSQKLANRSPGDPVC